MIKITLASVRRRAQRENFEYFASQRIWEGAAGDPRWAVTGLRPKKTEKNQTLEIGFKGFVTERIHLTADYYVSFYEDFFSSPTIVTPLIIKRQFHDIKDGQGITTDRIDITSVDNLSIVGMLPTNYNLSNPPYATQWDGRDNDNDYHYQNVAVSITNCILFFRFKLYSCIN